MTRISRLLGLRILQILPVVILATFVVFSFQQLLPGDPATVLAGESPTPERIAQVREQFGLDKPFFQQYGAWLWRVVHGDFSKSLMNTAEVADLIVTRLPVTLMIAGLAMVMTVAIGIPLGLMAVVKEGSILDAALSALGSLGVALPTFWLSMILVTIFAMKLGFFPVSGMVSPVNQPLEALQYAMLPALSLAAAAIAELTQQVRSAMLEFLASQHVRTLRAKGMTEAQILWRHGLKNISVTIITVMGLIANRLLGTTVVIESVFAIPGLGSLIAEAARSNDYTVIQGVVLVMVVMVIVLNLLVDIACAILDPRVS